MSRSWSSVDGGALSARASIRRVLQLTSSAAEGARHPASSYPLARSQNQRVRAPRHPFPVARSRVAVSCVACACRAAEGASGWLNDRAPNLALAIPRVSSWLWSLNVVLGLPQRTISSPGMPGPPRPRLRRAPHSKRWPPAAKNRRPSPCEGQGLARSGSLCNAHAVRRVTSVFPAVVAIRSGSQSPSPAPNACSARAPNLKASASRPW